MIKPKKFLLHHHLRKLAVWNRNPNREGRKHPILSRLLWLRCSQLPIWIERCLKLDLTLTSCYLW